MVYGKKADGTTWDLPIASRDGLVKYKKAVKDSKAADGPQGGDTRREPAAHSATTAAKAGIVRPTGIGAIAQAAKAVAAMAVASRAREETPVGGKREVSVLLDTGASNRNFISSKLASWLIECGSATLEMSGEIGFAFC